MTKASLSMKVKIKLIEDKYNDKIDCHKEKIERLGSEVQKLGIDKIERNIEHLRSIINSLKREERKASSVDGIRRI